MQLEAKGNSFKCWLKREAQISVMNFCGTEGLVAAGFYCV